MLPFVRSFRRLLGIFPVVALGMLAGCTTYAPAPLDVPAILAVRRGTTLDPERVAAAATAIAPGANPAYGPWDRLTLLAAALIYNPDIEVARSGVVSAEAGARASRVGSPATLTLSAEYARDAAAQSPWLLGAALDLPIDRGVRRAARSGVADIAVEIARYDEAEVIWTARMALRRALTDRLIAERRAAGFQVVADLRARQLAAVDRRVAAGEASRTELDRVRADGADASRGLIDALAQANDARLRLAAAIGLPPEALEGITPDWKGFDEPVSDSGETLDPEIRSQAILARADVLKALAAYDQAEVELRLEVARQYPALTLSPGYAWERGLVKFPVSLGLALPPLDLNRSAIALAEARRAEAGQRLEAILASADAAIESARAETSAARTALDRIRSVERPTADRLARQADRELSAGAIDRVDWAAAQAGAAQTRLVELDALARVHAAYAALEDAVRRPLEGPEILINAADVRSRP